MIKCKRRLKYDLVNVVKNVKKKKTHLFQMHVLQLGFGLLCCDGDYPCPLSPATLSLTLTLKHLQQPLNALVPSPQSLLLRVDSDLHVLHGLPQLGKLLGLPLVLGLQSEEVLLWWIQGRRWGEAITPRHLTGAAGPKGARTGPYCWTFAGTVELLIWTSPLSRLKGTGWAQSLCGYYRVTAVPRAVDDDISFVLPWVTTQGVRWASFGAVLWCRTMQVYETLPGAVFRAQSSSELLIHVVFSIRVPLVLLLPLATVRLSVSFKLLL